MYLRISFRCQTPTSCRSMCSRPHPLSFGIQYPFSLFILALPIKAEHWETWCPALNPKPEIIMGLLGILGIQDMVSFSKYLYATHLVEILWGLTISYLYAWTLGGGSTGCQQARHSAEPGFPTSSSKPAVSEG